jgi:hypothetical protein
MGQATYKEIVPIGSIDRTTTTNERVPGVEWRTKDLGVRSGYYLFMSCSDFVVTIQC